MNLFPHVSTQLPARNPVIRKKRLLTELVCNNQTTVEQRPDDSTVITLHPRQLPHEIITLILGHLADDLATLYRCLFVTKQFNPIATSLLWRIPNRRNTDVWKLFLDSFLAASPERRSILGRYIQRLDLTYWSHNNEFTSLFPYVPLLTHCKIQRTQVSRTPIQQLARYCQYLTTLHIRVSDVTEECFVVMGQHCHYLCDLDWYAVHDQTPVWLKYLSCPLQRLHLRCDDKTINHEALTVIQGMDQLRCLELFLDLPEPLTQLLGPYWPHLTKLCLGPCDTIPEHAWIDFFTSHLDIEHLNVGPIGTWTSLPSLPRLTNLYLDGNNSITSNDLRCLIQHSPRLVGVGIYHCDRIVAEDFSVDTHNNWMIHLDKRNIESIRKSGINCR